MTNTRHNSFLSWHLLLLLTFLLATSTCQLQVIGVTATNLVLGANADYTFSIFNASLPTSQPITVGSKLLLTFGTGFGLSTHSCTWASTGNFNSINTTCTATGNQLEFPSLFQNSSFLGLSTFTITVTNVVNPIPATTYIPVTKIEVRDVSNAIISTATSTSPVTIEPQTIQCSVNLVSNTKVFAQGTIEVTYPSLFINNNSAGYSLVASMPQYYPDDATQTLISPTFGTTTTGQNVGANNLYTFYFVSPFTIHMLMPPSTKPENNIINITSEDNAGTYDTCSLSLTGITSNTFTTFTVSQAVVQTTSALTFNLVLPTPLEVNDQIHITFGTAFDLTALTSTTIAVTSFNNFALSKISSSKIVLQVNMVQAILNANLNFAIPNIGMPFNTASTSIQVSVITVNNFFRADQTQVYTPLAGALGSTSMSCLSQQIGNSSSCTLTLTTTSTLVANSEIDVVLPSGFSTSGGVCLISGSGISGSCTYPSANIIKFFNVNSSTTGNINPLTLTLTLPITMSQAVATYSFTINTLSGGNAVDSGSASLTTVGRQLTNSQFTISSSSATTYSPTTYSLAFNLPFNPGFSSYDIAITIPVDISPSFSTPSAVSATVLSYSNQIVTVTAASVTSPLSILGLLTPISTAPITLTLNIRNNNTLIFYGTQTLSVISLRSFSTLIVTQSNDIVYTPFTATVTMSDLAVGDSIQLSTSFPSYFYQSNQSVCSSSVVNCQSGGILSVLSVGSANITTFTVGLVNQAFLGFYQLTFTVYTDSTHLFGKQTQTYTLNAGTHNTLGVSSNQSNPYLGQISTYSFILNFTTPNATNLTIVVSSSFTPSNVPICNKHCTFLSQSGLSYSFALSSTWTQITFENVTNPNQFAGNRFTFSTSNSQGGKDFGQYQPTAICTPPCKTCSTNNISFCLSCYSSSFFGAAYLLTGSCLGACPTNYYTDQFLNCLSCPSQCNGCTSPTVCTSCATNYSLYNQSCLASCPTGYYSTLGSNAQCITCAPTLLNCTSCSYVNLQPRCLTCDSNLYVQEWTCVSNCTIGNLSGQYCVSPSCSGLAQCSICSGTRCIRCSANYTLDSNFNCIINPVAATNTPAALAEVPVPFPFLIASIMVIILSFFLRYNYPKMFSPLFIYSLVGCLQELCLILWCGLTLYWNYNIPSPLPLISVAYAPALVLAAYGALNLIQFICWRCIIASDRKYKLWQKQDNKCSSVFIALLGLFLSFRLDAFKYSRTAHSLRLSARLSTPQLFKHYSVLAIVAMPLSAGSIVAAVYISYLQDSLNYLFFTCLQVTIISVLMIILSIVMLCVPKEQLLEDKNQFTYGHDEEAHDGPSLQEVLQVVEEHQSNGQMDSQGKLVMRKNSASDISSQDRTMLHMPEKLEGEVGEIGFDEEEGEQRLPQKVSKTRLLMAGMFPIDESPESTSHILNNQFEGNRKQALEKVNKYVPNGDGGKAYLGRQAGIIAKQKLQELPQDDSDSSYFGQFQEYAVNYPDKEWKKTSGAAETNAGLKMEKNQIDGDLLILRRMTEEELKAERQKESQERVEKIFRLNEKLQQMQMQEMELQEKQEELEEQNSQLVKKEQEKLREHKERQQMAVEDQLSKAYGIFYSLSQVRKGNQITSQKLRKISEVANDDSSEKTSKGLQYHNNDGQNLKDEPSPRKVKVNPEPTHEQIKRQHLYVEEGGQFKEAEDEEDYSNAEVDFIVESGHESKLEESKNVEKPNAILKRMQTAKKRGMQKFQKEMSQKKIKKDRQVDLNNLRVDLPVQKQKQIATALAPVQYERYHQIYEDGDEDQKIENKVSSAIQRGDIAMEPTRNMEIHDEEFDPDNQITVYDQEVIQVESGSEEPWPYEPEIKERIDKIQQRADFYIKGEEKIKKVDGKQAFVQEIEGDELYEEEQEDQDEKKTINEIVFDQNDAILPSEELTRSETKKRFGGGRVNRRIIDLS